MKLNKFLILSLFLTLALSSCKKEEDGPEIEPPRDRGEQEIADQEALQQYLDTHFYNYEDFENPSEAFDYNIVLDTIDAANSDKIPLSESDLLQTETMTVEGVEYTYYVLKVREGAGAQPTFADSTFVSYRGELLNQAVFDASRNPLWFDLPGYVVLGPQGRLVKQGGVIPGFAQALSEFRGATDFEVQPDNTVVWENDYGIGAVFMPSGLGYFSNGPGAIPSYSPLVFTFNLYGVNQTDHDGDGIPSYMEDLNGDENLFNDDTDSNGYPNHSDTDDDGDFIPTREEIVINSEGNLILTDTNGDGTPDYLDPSI